MAQTPFFWKAPIRAGVEVGRERGLRQPRVTWLRVARGVGGEEKGRGEKGEVRVRGIGVGRIEGRTEEDDETERRGNDDSSVRRLMLESRLV